MYESVCAPHKADERGASGAGQGVRHACEEGGGDEGGRGVMKGRGGG